MIATEQQATPAGTQSKDPDLIGGIGYLMSKR